MKQIDDILELYVSKDAHRAALLEPFIQDGYVYASNGEVLIRVKEDSLKTKKFKKQDKPICSQLFENILEIGVVTIESIKEKLSKIEMVDETITVGEEIKCKECDGDGIVEWEYERWTRDFECPSCDGDGYSENKRLKLTGKQIRDPEAGLEIINKFFKVKDVNVLIETMEFFHVQTIKAKSLNSFLSPIVFEINEDVTVLIMPYKVHE